MWCLPRSAPPVISSLYHRGALFTPHGGGATNFPPPPHPLGVGAALSPPREVSPNNVSPAQKKGFFGPPPQTPVSRRPPGIFKLPPSNRLRAASSLGATPRGGPHTPQKCVGAFSPFPQHGFPVTFRGKPRCQNYRAFAPCAPPTFSEDPLIVPPQRGN